MTQLWLIQALVLDPVCWSTSYVVNTLFSVHVLDWGQIGKGTVWLVVVVVVAVFFEHETDFPHQIEHFVGQ
jgi:hypothetical protein